MRLSRPILSGLGSSRRTARIVIPNLDGSTPTSNSGTSATSQYARGGSLHTDRFMANPGSSSSRGNHGDRSDGAPHRQKLFEHGKYASTHGTRDRWSGEGPVMLRQDPANPYGAAKVVQPADYNDHQRTFARVEGAPTSHGTSPNEGVAKVLGGAEADFVRGRREQRRFLSAVDQQHEQVWRDSKSHIRQQERLMAQAGGLEGAIADRLSPNGSRATGRNELMNRKLDKRILEEIYKDLHGRRSEQALKKNVHWERWTARTDSNAPVMAASRKAQETFGFGGTAELVKSATTLEQFPISPLPEVAFLGRTNSGRSSLINAILNNYVCRYGHMKGTTKTADFVNVANKLMIVDLPGYGYFHPFASDPLRVKQGQAINEAYIAACADFNSIPTHLKNGGNSKGSSSTAATETTDGRRAAHSGKQRNLKRIFICVPANTGLHDGDLSLCDMLQERNIPFSVLLTKTDTVAIRMLARAADLVREKLAKYTMCEELMLVNALRLAGITRVQNLLGNVARQGELSVDPLKMSFDTIM